jgi:dihydrofolate synthase/folylpolyglutamate synthase
VPLILDVAHNPHATGALAVNLAAMPVSGKTRAVLAVLDDKDLSGMLAPLLGLIDGWYCAGLPNCPRGLPVDQLKQVLAGALAELPGEILLGHYADPQQALLAAEAASGPGDRIVAFGSFYTVAALARD